ncbi:MAG: hypothetical protein SWH54_02445 [Thermodesulfobacteriota bacterium]|nr:hypothetical protein [Thermodesulfobacteriota bacterium]
MGLKYKFNKAQRIIEDLDHKDLIAVKGICEEIQMAQNNLFKEGKEILAYCQHRCRGLCCRNIQPDEIITLTDFVYILVMESSVRGEISECLKKETLFSSNCIFLKGGEGPCIFPSDLRPEMCITSFCGGDNSIKKEINGVETKFNKLVRFFLLRKPRRFKNLLFKTVGV